MSPVDLRRTPPACTTSPEFVDPPQPTPTVRLADERGGLTLTPIDTGATLVAWQVSDGVEEGDPTLVGVALDEAQLRWLSVAMWAVVEDRERARGER